jgi:membrane protease YdiL (CAAX protease family)
VTAAKELALLFAVLFLPGMLGQSIGVDPSAFTQIAYLVQVLAISIPQILLVLAVSDLRRPGTAEQMGWHLPRARDLPPAFAGLIGAWIAALLAGLLAAAITSGAAASTAVDWVFDRYELIPLVLLATLAIGYREEIFYRAYLASRAEELGLTPRQLLYAGTLVFGLGHLYQGIGGLLVSVAVGIVFAEVFLRSRSLHGIAIAHGLFNFLTLLQAGSA